MIVLWLPVLNGEVRLYHEAQWLSYPSLEALHAALVSFELIKQKKPSGSKSSLSAQVYIPTLQVTQVRQPMGKSQYQKLGAQGVAFLLENHVLGSVDNLSVKSTMVDDDVVIAAVTNSVIQQLKHSLGLVGLEVRAVLPDFLLLPKPRGLNSAFAYSDELSTILRTDEHSGVHVDDMTLTLSKLNNLNALDIAGSGFAATKAQLTNSDMALHQADVAQIVPAPSAERHVFNLLPKVKSSALSTYWRAVAAVFFFAVVSLLVYDTMRLWRYGKIEKAYQNQIYKQYSHWFSAERPPADVRRALQSKIGLGSKQGGEVFALVSRVSALLKQSGLDASKLTFFNNTLEVRMEAANIEQLQALVGQLSDQGIKASLGNVEPVGSSVSGVILIKNSS